MRAREYLAVASLHVRTNLCSEPEHEAPLRCGLQIISDLSADHRVASESDCHRSTERQPLGYRRDAYERKKRVTWTIEGKHPIETESLEPPCSLTRGDGIGFEDRDVELHVGVTRDPITQPPQRAASASPAHTGDAGSP